LGSFLGHKVAGAWSWSFRVTYLARIRGSVAVLSKLARARGQLYLTSVYYWISEWYPKNATKFSTRCESISANIRVTYVVSLSLLSKCIFFPTYTDIR
jgi:hypothetical protein